MAILILMAGCLLAGSAANLPAQHNLVLEQQVKAAYLYNFAKFVEWPGQSADNSAPLVFGVMGDGSFAGVLEKAVGGKTVNNRPLVVKRVSELEELHGCHILFIGRSEKTALEEILRAVGNTGVLAVGETPAFAHRGGMVNFVMEEGKVRFEINVDAAARSGLRISSKLLRLARVIRSGPGGN